jgi:hypothetical protein
VSSGGNFLTSCKRSAIFLESWTAMLANILTYRWLKIFKTGENIGTSEVYRLLIIFGEGFLLPFAQAF